MDASIHAPPLSRPKERRGTKARSTINQILEKMEEEADVHYQGNLPDNAVKIFTWLPIDDRRTFLRHSLNLLWAKRIELAQKGLQDIIIEEKVRIDPTTVLAERKNLEAADIQEQMKLKTFVFKTFFILGILIFSGILTWSWFYGSSAGNTESLLKNLNKIVEILLTK
jgi:hypothetical protein